MLISFLIAYSVCSTVALMVAGGKALSSGHSSSSASTGNKEKPLKVRNPEDETGRFYVKEAYEWGNHGLFALVVERENEENRSLLKATSIEDLEEQIERAYVRLEGMSEYMKQKRRKT